MEVVSQRLAAIYKRLQDSELVRTKDPTPENVERFKRILNMSVPVTDYDMTLGEVGRFFYNTNRYSFVKFLGASGLQHFVLVTDGYPIVKQLDLVGIIIVKWNRQQQEFDIEVGAGATDDTEAPQPVRKQSGGHKHSSRGREPRQPATRGRGGRGSKKTITPLSYQEFSGIMTALKTSSTRVDSNVKSHKEALSDAPSESDSPKNTPEIVKTISVGSWADATDDYDQ